ncbi:MAG: hypothetical protein FD169_1765 [Bacillota bacterium]|nr:MAG: hypothetical protein FD169_1765 [Bacillota bacterium]MBS3949265.1 hypothetical protein [Peptococcaceae bacterium]
MGTHNGKVYETYALTESYREGGKVKHRNIASLGALAPEQIQRMLFVLKAQRIDGAFVGHLSDVVAKQHFRCLRFWSTPTCCRSMGRKRLTSEKEMPTKTVPIQRTMRLRLRTLLETILVWCGIFIRV